MTLTMNGVEVVETLAPRGRPDAGAVPLGPRARSTTAWWVCGPARTTTWSSLYAFAELMARSTPCRRRRETGAVATTLKVGELEMNLINRTVHRQGKEIDLQPREFQLLEFMMRSNT